MADENYETNEDLEKYTSAIRELLPELRQRFKVKSLGVFGSYVKGKQTEDSDLDLLVEFNETPGLLRFIAMENFLSDVLEVKVDLVRKDGLKPAIGKRILAEVVSI